MVAYSPPDSVLVAIGAVVHTEHVIAAADRITLLLKKDRKRLEPFGIDEETFEIFEKRVRELKGMSKDKRTVKNDTPLQMNEVNETLALSRGWLRTLRAIASINLCGDTPSLYRIASAEPELAEVYPRDVLHELRVKLKAASDMKPRLEEVGLDQTFLGRGRRLAAQLDTALGKKDIDGDNLSIIVRRFYIRKAQIYILLKRITRAGGIAFMLLPKRRSLYHLEELEPSRIVTPANVVKPKPQTGSSGNNGS